MNIDGLKQRIMSFIQELRNIREDAIRGNLAKDRTFFLMRTKLREFEEDAVAEPYPFSDDDASVFFKVVKWHYWKILYSLFGDELAKLEPEFERGEVPILLPGIKILFETEQLSLPDSHAPDTQAPEQKAANLLTDADCLKKLEDTGFIMINPHFEDRTVYLVKKGHSALDVFDELTKMTGSELRARSIMLQNMTGVESTLNTHRPKHTLKT
jgi:hypothetical protein